LEFRRPFGFAFAIRIDKDKDKDSPTARVITFILIIYCLRLDGESDGWFGVTDNRRLILLNKFGLVKRLMIANKTAVPNITQTKNMK